MKYLLLILSTSILLSSEMEVDGDLKVTGTVESVTIDSLKQEIADLKLLIAQLQAQIAILESQMALVGGDLGYADCFGVVGGSAVVDECGICGGSGMPDGECDCFGNVLDACGVCGGDAISEEECGSCTDYDGNTYETVEIGEQVWMAENLKVTHYRDGSEIPNITNNGDWSGLSTGAYGDYDNNPTNSETYGKLYNWYTVDDSRGVCPEGWHVPSDNEYTVLTDYLGGAGGAGGKMKEAGLDHWNSPNTDATNESGFTGLPAGYRYLSNGLYLSMGGSGYFWSSSELGSDSAWYRYLGYDVSDVARYGNSKQFGFSIRCLGD